MNQLFKVNEVSENRKLSFLMTLRKSKSHEILKNLVVDPRKPSEITYNKTLEELRHCSPSRLVVTERLKSYKLHQFDTVSLTEIIVRV